MSRTATTVAFDALHVVGCLLPSSLLEQAQSIQQKPHQMLDIPVTVDAVAACPLVPSAPACLVDVQKRTAAIRVLAEAVGAARQT